MGGIILGLLRGIGIAFLVLLTVLLCLMLIVLFDPITYRIDGRKYPEVLFGRVKVNWLFGLIRFRLLYEDKLQMKLYVLWFDLLKMKKTKKKDVIQKDAGTEGQPVSGEHPITGEQEHHSASETEEESSAVAQGEGENAPDASREESTGAESRKKTFFQKLKGIFDTIRGIRDKITDIWNNITAYKELLENSNTKLLWKNTKPSFLRILRAVCPAKGKGRIRYGTGAPDTTGYLYGVYGVLSPKLGKCFLVEPDFQEQVLEGEIQMKGRIFLITILVNGVSVLFRKELRIFIRQMKSIQTKTGR